MKWILMDLDGFKVFTNEEFDAYIEAWKNVFKVKKSYTMYVGTNEDIEYEEFERTLDVSALDHGEYRTIQDHLGTEFGFFPEVPDEDMLEGNPDSDDEEDD